MSSMKLWPRTILALVIRGYRQVISPLFPATCKYYPTCSMYAIEAVEKQGVFRGGWLAIKRIVRCNPWSHGGYDPVP
ncbi:MAG: membrane protein insertion efficiency factor YidD [Coriobacteriia bacterium]|nr:membrane protein insertion efficiency factor YidD [Coriobacteriia bacterium]